MSRAMPTIILILVAGGIAAFFVKLGAYNTHTVGGDTVVMINRFNGRAFQIRNGLREPIVDSNLENRVSKLFEQAYEKGKGFDRPASAPVVIERTRTVQRDEDNPFSGVYGNPLYKGLSEADQFEFLKSWANSWTQPFQNRSALISASGRDKTYQILVKSLLDHPYARVLSNQEKDDIREYYRLRVYGQ